MSATTFAPESIDISRTSPVPMARLVKVELRKMVDTRAGLWLLIAIGAITTLAVVIFGLAGPSDKMTFTNFMDFAATPQGFLLPVLGILLVTQEWGQRTAMVTFTLEPHRGRVISAKISAALLLGLMAIVLAFVVATLATLVFGGTAGFNNVSGFDFFKFGLLQITGVLEGLAFGLIFLNSAAAIVTSFVLPTAVGIVAGLWGALHIAAPWINLGTAQQPLYKGGSLSGTEWSQLLVAIAIWVVVPFSAGLWRMLRAEFK